MLPITPSVPNFSVTNGPGLPPIATFDQFLQAYKNDLLPVHLEDAIEQILGKFELDLVLEIHNKAGKPDWSTEQCFDHLKAIQENFSNPFHVGVQQLLAIGEGAYDIDLDELAASLKECQDAEWVEFSLAERSANVEESLAKLTPGEKDWYQLAVDNYIKPVLPSISPTPAA